jgi:hypothetical protein
MIQHSILLSYLTLVVLNAKVLFTYVRGFESQAGAVDWLRDGIFVVVALVALGSKLKVTLPVFRVYIP